MKKSFTLIETLVAISIFILCISFVVSGLSRYLSAQQTINNQLIAAYLAQEAIEKIRNLRDANWLRERRWDENIGSGSSTCFDFQSTSFPALGCSICSPLKIDNEGFYNCQQGQNSIFTREVSVSKDSNTIQITVTVRWQEKWGQRSITVGERLYNWLGSV